MRSAITCDRVSTIVKQYLLKEREMGRGVFSSRQIFTDEILSSYLNKWHLFPYCCITPATTSKDSSDFLTYGTTQV